MIRRATPEDVDAIVGVFERISATRTYLPIVHTHEEHLAWFAARVADWEAYVWDDDGVEFGDGSRNEEGVPDVRYAWSPPADRVSSGR